MKKILFTVSLCLLLGSFAQAHTSISFSVYPNMGVEPDYERVLIMEQMRAARLQNRLMQMGWAQADYPGNIHIVQPIYAEAMPYTMRPTIIYTGYLNARIRCHNNRCPR